LLANGRDSRLQGQADNIVNIQLGYDDYAVNSQATLIINHVSDRVRARGLDVLPDIIEQIPTTIDFVYGREFELDTSMLKISLEIRNLLNEDYEATMANSAIFYDQYQLGTSVSLGFKLSF
jgi:outer membrane receptor protein involved in Fe transport